MPAIHHSHSSKRRESIAGEKLDDNFANRFFGNVSIPMARFMLPCNNMPVRLLSAAVIILGVTLTLYQVYGRVLYFYTYPIAVVVTETNQDNQTMPAIVICPAGQFRPIQSALINGFGTLATVTSGTDMKHIEEHRDDVIADIRNQNFILTSAKIDYFHAQLTNIRNILGRELKVDGSLEWSASRWQEILGNLQNMTETFATIFPVVTSMLASTTEQDAARSLSLNVSDWYKKKVQINKRKIFALFRDRNTIENYDCKDYHPLTDSRTWQEAFPEMLQCFLGYDYDKSHGLVAEISSIFWYPVMVNLARTTWKDILLDCKWMGKECAITDSWTPIGKCFRVGPTKTSDANVVNVGSHASVNILIDTLNNEFPKKDTKVYFYQQEETEFAQLAGGITIKPGLVSHLVISQVRYNLRTDTNCGTRKLRSFISYTKEKCVWEQRTVPIGVQCGCVSDLTPDYFKYVLEELPRMENQESYLNGTHKLCSLVDSLTCAPSSQATEYDCPNNCEEKSYEVDMMTNPIDDKLIFPRLPTEYDENNLSLNMQHLSEYGGFQFAPGAFQLDIALEKLFEYHLRLIDMFWWKEEDPYYPTWFQWHNTMEIGTRGSYFGPPPYGTSSKMPCFKENYNETMFHVIPERTSLLIAILKSYKSKYENLHNNWSTNYTEEVYYPFMNEISEFIDSFHKNKSESSKMEIAVLKKIQTQMNKFYDTMTIRIVWLVESTINEQTMWQKKIMVDPQLAHFWAPQWLIDLEEAINESSSFINATVNEILNLVNTNRGKTSSVWSKPLAIYLDWFMNDLPNDDGVPDSTTDTIQHAFSINANSLDVYTVVGAYGQDSALREQLRRTLVNISNAIKDMSSHLLLINQRLCKLVPIYEFIDGSPICIDDEPGFYEPLLVDTTNYAALKEINECVHDHFIEFYYDWSLDGKTGVLRLTSDGSSTLWFSEFTNLVDNVLKAYSPGTGYHEASLSNINIFFRSFGQRTIQEMPEYTAGSLLSDIGGALGLWIGATVITLFELAILCFSPRFVQVFQQENLAQKLVKKANEPPVQRCSRGRNDFPWYPDTHPA